MQCPSCGHQIDQPGADRCPRCGYGLTPSSGLPPQGDTSAIGGSNQPPQYNPYPSYTPATEGAPNAPTQQSPSGYGVPPQSSPDQYGSYAPPSGYGQPAPPSGYNQPYGQPAPPSGYSQPYGQPAPPSYPMAPGSGYPPPGYPQQPFAPQPKRKRRTGLIVGIIVAVVAVLVVCAGGGIFALIALGSATDSVGSGSTTSLNGTPITGATPATSGTVIYANTFKSNANDWTQAAGECTLESDGYHILDNYICYAPIGAQSDVNVSVDVQQLSGPTTHAYGLVFRRVSAGNYYDFLIDSNGKWLFEKCVDNNCTSLVDFTVNSAIKGGLNTSNTLKLVAQGSHFEFFVNGTRVGAQDDTTFSSGKVGLEGGASVDCVFNNLVIARPN